MRAKERHQISRATHHEPDGEQSHELCDDLDAEEHADPAQADDEARDLARERVEPAEREHPADEDVEEVACGEGREGQGELAVVADRLAGQATDFGVDAEETDVTAEADGDEDVAVGRRFRR